jgi:hypothetical protein
MRLREDDTFPEPTYDTNADVSGATSIRFRLMNIQDIGVIDDDAEVVDAPTGVVKYPDSMAALPPGGYRGAFVVTFASGKVQHFPQAGNLEVVIGQKVTVLVP